MAAGRNSRELPEVAKNPKSHWCSGTKHCFQVEDPCRGSNLFLFSWFVGNLPGFSRGVTQMQASCCAAVPIEDKVYIFVFKCIKTSVTNTQSPLYNPFSLKCKQRRLKFLNCVDFYGCRTISTLSFKSPEANSITAFHRDFVVGESVTLHPCPSLLASCHSFQLLFT